MSSIKPRSPEERASWADYIVKHLVDKLDPSSPHFVEGAANIVLRAWTIVEEHESRIARILEEQAEASKAESASEQDAVSSKPADDERAVHHHNHYHFAKT